MFGCWCCCLDDEDDDTIINAIIVSVIIIIFPTNEGMNNRIVFEFDVILLWFVIAIWYVWFGVFGSASFESIGMCVQKNYIPKTKWNISDFSNFLKNQGSMISNYTLPLWHTHTRPNLQNVIQ